MAVAAAGVLTHLQDGTWLNRERLRIGAAILLAVEVAIFLFLVVGTHGRITPLSQPTTTDFVSFYAAGKRARRRHARARLRPRRTLRIRGAGDQPSRPRH